MNDTNELNQCIKSSKRGQEVSCQNCGFIGMLELLENEKVDEELSRLILTKKRPLMAGEILYQAGQAFDALYAIRGGSLKSYTLLDGKEEQIIGFHLPGEILGLDAINGHYTSTVQAMEDSAICRISFEYVALLKDRYPAFREQLLQLSSKQILLEQRQSLLAARRTADERLAAFLLNFAQRLKARNFNDTQFRLVMSRPDIANYLGLADATISRAFKRFQKDGLLDVSGRHVKLLDISGLGKVAGISDL